MPHATIPTSEPIELGREAVLHLATDLSAQLLAVDSSYWEHADRHPELNDGRILSVFDYTSTWTWWERHPVGEEFLYLVSGKVDFLLDDAGGQRAVHLFPGHSAIVPTGAWHRAVVHIPSRLLFVTPTPARTEHRSA